MPAADKISVQVDGRDLALSNLPKVLYPSDGFTKADLLAGAGTAIIIHAGADNFGNIPADRYNQVNGGSGPDQTTMMTGDAGKRVACGVIGSG